MARLKELKKMTKHCLAFEKSDQKAAEMRIGELPSQKSELYDHYINHKLKMFNRKCDAYMSNDIANIKFNIYRSRQQICSEFCNKNQRTLIGMDKSPPIKKD